MISAPPNINVLQRSWIREGFWHAQCPKFPPSSGYRFFSFLFFCDWGNRFIRFIRINYCCSHKIREASCGTPLKNNLLETSLNQEWFPRGKHPEEESLCKWWYNKSGGVVCLPWVMHFAYSTECLQTKGLQKVENSQQDKLSSIRWIVIGLYDNISFLNQMNFLPNGQFIVF